MSTKFKVLISPDGGSIDSVYEDPLDSIASLGPARIWRATEVFYNNSKGCWEVQGRPPLFLGEPTLSTGFCTHKSAIAWEVKFLQANMATLRKVLDAKRCN